MYFTLLAIFLVARETLSLKAAVQRIRRGKRLNKRCGASSFKFGAFAKGLFAITSSQPGSKRWINRETERGRENLAVSFRTKAVSSSIVAMPEPWAYAWVDLTPGALYVCNSLVRGCELVHTERHGHIP